MKLYHAGKEEIRELDIYRGRKNADFGQGFYLTSSKEQAQSFAKISTSKAIGRNLIPPKKYGVVSTYTFVGSTDIAIFDYAAADVNWLHCVVGHRRNRYFLDVVEAMKAYDVISGKIANDATNITITAYLDGLYGEIGSDTADTICIRLLLPERQQDQYCFRTENDLKTQKFERSEQIWL